MTPAWPINRNHEAARRHVNRVLRDHGRPDYSRRESEIAQLLDELVRDRAELYRIYQEESMDATIDPAQRMLRYFTYEHLTHERLREVSRPFCEMAHDLVRELPPGPETTTCLRKLLEAKDCAVRAVLVP